MACAVCNGCGEEYDYENTAEYFKNIEPVEGYCCDRCYFKAMKTERKANQVERGVISPISLKAGIFALMCMTKTVVEQWDSSGGINVTDFRDLKEHLGKMDKALKELGL